MPSSPTTPRSPSVRSSSASEHLQERLAEHAARLDEHRQHLAAQRTPGLTLSPTINAMSKRLIRTESVEEVLHQMGKTYAEKLNQKRQSVLEAELAEVTGAPEVTKMAKKIQRDGSVHDRLASTIKETTRKVESLRETAMKEREEELKSSFSPQINKASLKLRRPSAVHELLYQWGQDARKKHDAERQRLETEMTAEMKAAPQISERSKKLAAKVRESRPIEDQLLEAAAQQQQQRETAADLYFINTVPAYPRITERAASLVRTGDVGERLYQQSLKKQQRLAELREAQELLAEELARSESPSTPRKVELELLRRGAEAEMKRQLERQRLEVAESTRHRPVINAHSVEIEQRLPHTAEERLLRAPRRSVTPPPDVNLTFRPTLNAASVAIAEERAARGATTGDRIDHLIKHKLERERKLQAMREEKQRKEEEECTFKPNVPRAQVSDSHRDVLDRLSVWHAKRTARLDAEREEKNKKAMEECTFRPTVSGEVPPSPSTPAPTASSSTPTIKDYDKFLERQKKGRESREAVQHVPHATGDKWRPKPTQPEEFHFHSRVSVRSLDKPVPPTPRPHTAPVSKELSFDEFASIVRSAWDDTTETPRRQQPSAAPLSARSGVSNGFSDSAAVDHIAALLAELGPSSAADREREPSQATSETSAAATAEWHRRAKEKQAWEAEHDSGAGHDETRPWRDTPVTPDRLTGSRSTTGEAEFLSRQARARQLKEESNPDRAFADGSGWRAQRTVPQEFRFQTDRRDKSRTPRQGGPLNVSL